MSATVQPHPLAGRPVPPELLIDPARLEAQYYERQPDPSNPLELISFGTSGHRGNPLEGTFNEAHILAVTQAICDYRRAQGIAGPLFMGKDTHAASAPAERTALEVLAANEVVTVIQSGGGFTPTPAVSRAILAHNREHPAGLADGIVITPSHNPPSDGGFKYNPPKGGPADTDITTWIQDRANTLLREGNRGVRRMPYDAALKAGTTRREDFVQIYLRDLESVVDIAAIRAAGVRIGIDPLGGAAVGYWGPLQERFRLNLTVVNTQVDPTFRFMTVDHDGKVRMDCSSPHAMASLVQWKDRFDVAFGNDPDADRHGIVTPAAGLLNPNHYLAVAIHYLLTHRPHWPKTAEVGKTVVSSSLIDRVVAELDRELWEVPVGFKWFAPHLYDGSIAFGGEESAGASFVCQDGSPWVTDKDGLLLGLLAAEITARTGKDPGRYYAELTDRLGTPAYARVDTPATPEQKRAFSRLTGERVTATTLGGAPILQKLTQAPGNRAPIGGLKVVTAEAWFAARPSGTENLYKLYAESFKGPEHLAQVQTEARQMVASALAER